MTAQRSPYGNWFSRWLLPGAVALAAFPVAAQGAGALASAVSVGQVSLIIGEARVTRGDGTRAQLRYGSDVFVGDRVQTGANGHVHMRFVDRGAVSVRPDSVLEVQAYRYDPSRPQANEVRLRIEHGTARSISGAATELDKSRFRLNTPIAAIGVRGTDFIVQTSGDQMRAVVAQGSISVAPLGGGCSATALGPCVGDQVRILSADMGHLMVELRQSDGMVRLAPAVAALLPPLHYGDASIRERAAGEAAARATALAAAQPSADLHSRTNDTAVADLLAISPVGRFDARVLNTKPDSDSAMVWGRYSFASPGFDNISVRFADAAKDRQPTVGDLDSVLLRSVSTEALGNAGVVGDLGRIDLRLTRAQASFEVNGRIEPASVDGGTLALDFGRRTFATALAMSSSATGRVELRAGGQIDSRGIFNAGDAEQRVSGAVTFDGKEAGYLFERAAGTGLFKGRTLWGKGP